MKDNACTYCGQVGHRAHRCPARQRMLSAIVSFDDEDDRMFCAWFWRTFVAAVGAVALIASGVVYA